ncbi:MAG: hypothetical protein ACYSSI_00360 [Planctomycetota bacterium]|jgi:hypothetical protein
MKKVHTHTFNGVKYNIDVDEPFEALCESPRDTDTKPSIRVAVDINTLKGLKALFHECVHASAWSLSEEVVDRIANDSARLFWRLGFRRKS